MAGLTYRFKVGKFDCRIIADGTGTDDASGVAPVGASLEEWLQALHEHNIPPNQLPYSYNVLFVDTGRQRILVDTGRGGSSGQLLGTLSAEGIQTGDIDVVIITHGHGDHFGGLMIRKIDQIRLDKRDAQRTYEEAIRLAPDDEHALRMLIDIHYRQGNQVEAIKRLDQLLSLYAKNKQPQRMTQLLEELVTLCPNDAGLHSRLAAIYRQLGRKADAIKQVDALGELLGELTFPNARYFMAKDEWKYWTSETNLAGMDENSAWNIRMNLLPLKDRIDLIDGEGEIVPGFYAVPAPGHTPTHMAVLVRSEGGGLLVIADAARHPIQVEHPEWSHPFDRQPDVASETRRRLFSRAANENLLLTAYHFPFPGVVRIRGSVGALRWQPVG